MGPSNILVAHQDGRPLPKVIDLISCLSRVNAMSDSISNSGFEEQLRLLQAGDERAIEAFVAQYEPYIRRAIRFRIKDAALMAAADSVDVCQSVLGGFLLKLSAGDYVLHCEADLRGLLMSIAKKKFAMLWRRESAEKRARTRTRSLDSIPEVVSSGTSPESRLELKELISRVRQGLTDHEWDLLQQRRNGASWIEIESQLQVSAVVLKKRLSRALHRVAVDLGIDL